MALHELIYVSLAVREMDTSDLSALLDESRAFNEAHDITGMLIYHRQEFMQLLEGDEAEILALYEKIRKDARHHEVIKYWDGPIKARSFAAWSMAFVAPEASELRKRPGYEALLEQGLAASLGDSTGRRLLVMVRKDFLRADD
ncbi:BLUF domain-containing protein [Hydrogenophaga sp.]|uniref:BLUF domain-containing protein n=1 Tax=Hydrogenophaga sp. TaxID=1904254 RepID=UPI0035618712